MFKLVVVFAVLSCFLAFTFSQSIESVKFDSFRNALVDLGVGHDATNVVQLLRGAGLGQFVNATKQTTRKHLSGSYLPVIQMHGMGDFANDPFGMVPLKKAISDYLDGAYVLNVQIGESSIADIMNGFIMNLDDQVEYFANVVRSDANLNDGFNAVGYSQGNLVIRGYIERFNNPPVFNFISMHGPLAGVGAFPGCAIEKNICKVFSEILGSLAYYPLIQQHLAQANYFRDPLKIDDYLAGDRFLADINNEKPGIVTDSYTNNWTSLKSACLVKANGDTVVVPNDSEWFGFFKDGTFKEIWSLEQTPWYTADSFGLKTLKESGRLFFNTTDGNHLDFETDYLLDLVGTYFK